MKDIIQQIMNQENLDEIYGYAQNALFKDGPVSITTLEILSYLKLFAPDHFFHRNRKFFVYGAVLGKIAE